METLIEEVTNEVKSKIDSLPYWQQEVTYRLIKEAILLAYKQGRDDQRYASEGPLISMYE